MTRAARLVSAILAAVLALSALPASAQSKGPFSDWAAVFVAGDFRAHSGAPSEVFDNARRDLAQAFVAVGFSAQNVRQFSTHPANYPDATPFPSRIDMVARELDTLSAQAQGGCLVYFTSHGSPDGAVVGREFLSPQMARAMLDQTCGKRPTVAVFSTCYSGVFVPELAAPNRMILTAARPDRSSFGCGDNDKYPYFDACMLESLPKTQDFVALGRMAIACVARREKETGMAPPSEPQISVGADLRAELPLMPFNPIKAAAASPPGS